MKLEKLFTCLKKALLYQNHHRNRSHHLRKIHLHLPRRHDDYFSYRACCVSIILVALALPQVRCMFLAFGLGTMSII